MKLKKTNEQPTRITNQLYLQITHGKAKEGENTENIFWVIFIFKIKFVVYINKRSHHHQKPQKGDTGFLKWLSISFTKLFFYLIS